MTPPPRKDVVDNVSHLLEAEGMDDLDYKEEAIARDRAADALSDERDEREQQQLNLLLTVARVLRAQTRDRVDPQGVKKYDDDLWALNDALAPYEGVQTGAPVNEEPNRC